MKTKGVREQYDRGSRLSFRCLFGAVWLGFSFGICVGAPFLASLF